MIEHPEPGRVTWAVIAPEGSVAFYSQAGTREVEELVAGHYPGALGGGWVVGPIRVLASDMGLLSPEHFAPNAVAEAVIASLSEGRLVQPWRGHVALVEYEQDSGPGSIGEWLGPCQMSTVWIGRVVAALANAGARRAKAEQQRTGQPAKQRTGQPVTLRLPEKLWAAWQAGAAEHGCNRTEYVRRALSLARWHDEQRMRGNAVLVEDGQGNQSQVVFPWERDRTETADHGEHASSAPPVDWSEYVGHPIADDEPPPVCGREIPGGKCLCVLIYDGEGYYCPSCDELTEVDGGR